MALGNARGENGHTLNDRSKVMWQEHVHKWTHLHALLFLTLVHTLCKSAYCVRRHRHGGACERSN